MEREREREREMGMNHTAASGTHLWPVQDSIAVRTERHGTLLAPNRRLGDTVIMVHAEPQVSRALVAYQ